jgi:hypothetical protein
MLRHQNLKEVYFSMKVHLNKIKIIMMNQNNKKVKIWINN